MKHADMLHTTILESAADGGRLTTSTLGHSVTAASPERVSFSSSSANTTAAALASAATTTRLSPPRSCCFGGYATACVSPTTTQIDGCKLRHLRTTRISAAQHVITGCAQRLCGPPSSLHSELAQRNVSPLRDPAANPPHLSAACRGCNTHTHTPTELGLLGQAS